MKFRLLFSLALTSAMFSNAQTDSIVFRRISDDILLHGTCYDNLRVLCKKVGKRLSGSPAADKAVVWGENAMKAAGADKVWMQPVDVPVWNRGNESLTLKINGKDRKVEALALGNTEGTAGKVLEAPIVMVKDFTELDQLPEDKVKGSIVFFNYRFRQDFVNPFNAYGDAVKYRWASPSIAAKKGAAGVIIRSMSTGMDDYAHTGSMRYNDSFAKIPAMALGNQSADMLEQACIKGSVIAKMQSEAHMQEKTKRSYNVIGELVGTEHPERIITVGGHLDSWDVGEGAHDDGAGCVQSIEVIRVFKALGIKPKCTIRAVLFMNEENGLKGGMAYADSAASKKENHILAIETDAGGFSPRGIGMEMPEKCKAHICQYKSLFLPYNVYDFDQDEGGADIGPLHRKLNVPVAGLLPDAQRYFDYHHTNADVFEAVNHRELKLGAVTLAQFIYLVSEHGLE